MGSGPGPGPATTIAPGLRPRTHPNSPPICRSRLIGRPGPIPETPKPRRPRIGNCAQVPARPKGPGTKALGTRAPGPRPRTRHPDPELRDLDPELRDFSEAPGGLPEPEASVRLPVGFPKFFPRSSSSGASRRLGPQDSNIYARTQKQWQQQRDNGRPRCPAQGVKLEKRSRTCPLRSLSLYIYALSLSL